ncbi:MAG: hypothetical protein HKM89_13590 [Gemmatimonadales bacterium]|nr:hypothetical protein [Gemmatimonadales bacterium]
MNNIAAISAFLGVLSLGMGSHVQAQTQLTENVVSDPAKAVFVYDDVQRFARALELISAGGDTSEVLQREYLDLASPGLRMFVEKYDLTLDRLVGAIRKHPRSYAAIPGNLTVLTEMEDAFRKAYAELRRVIPDAVFPPTYYLVGGHRGIGSGSVEGPIISIEKKTPSSIREHLAATLVHEMVHMEQLSALGERYFEIFSGEKRTLLALSIREGVAMYFSERVTGGSPHKNLARNYLREHERELWAAFRKDMLGTDMGDWLWQEPANPDQPRDLGYAMGSRIVEAYDRRAGGTARSVREILAITDYPAFLDRSGYGEQFRD